MASEVENFLARALLQYVQAEDFKCAMSLMDQHKANPYHVVKESGIAPIHFAVCMPNEKSSVYFTKYFLKYSGDPNVKTEDGETCLHIACYYGRTKIVEMLVLNGGDITIKDNDGNTALNITINEGHFEIFDMLKKMIFEAKEKKRNEIVPADSDTPAPERLTLNHINYDMDCASPYYVNITRRKKRPPAAAPQQNQIQNQSNEASIEVEQANIFQLNETNLQQFQKTNQRLSRMSLVNTWRDKLVNTEINYDELVSEFNNLQFSSTKLPSDFELDLSHEITNKFNNIKASSTKLPQELAVEIASDTFITAKSSDSSPSEKSFIKSPNRFANNDEDSPDNQVQLVEDYRHIDRENGLVFYERKIEPCLSRTTKADSQTTASSKFTIPSDYNTVDLRRELTQFGDSPGPITKSTKYLYMKRLMKFKRHPERANIPASIQKQSYSIELEKTLKPNIWQDILEQYAEMELESKMVNGFQSAEFPKNNREDCLKKSFVYILIDPIMSENLPGNAKNLEPLEAWKRFLQSIFYIGKGTSSRPYCHLYDAIKMYQQRLVGNNSEPGSKPGSDSPWTKKVKETEKLKRINAIWKADKGVICLNVFHNIMGVEAYSREACIIEAIGLDNLTNLKRGEYHGLPKHWPMRDRKQLGAVLLYKSFKIYLSEGESQLRPTDIKS